MKLVYKGVLKSEDQLPLGQLPENAVMFKEPTSMDALAGALLKPVVALSVLVILFYIAISLWRHWDSPLEMWGLFSLPSLLGLALFIPAMIVHEFLHAIWFGKRHVVELYVSLNFFMVVCVEPISKARFIWLSLFPNIVLGWLPLVAWAFMPFHPVFSNALFVFAMLATVCGVGDYYNVYNAAKQMPKGSMQQLSGMNSYWFMP